MITIRYRPLAFSRPYESVCLPVPPTLVRRTDSYAAVAPRETDEQWAARMDAGLVAMLRSPPSTQVVITSRVVTPRPDPLGDAVARGSRPRARTTTEIPIAVDATLPAIAAALARLETDLATLGLGHHAARARAIGLAVETVRDHVDPEELAWKIKHFP